MSDSDDQSNVGGPISYMPVIACVVVSVLVLVIFLIYVKTQGQPYGSFWSLFGINCFCILIFAVVMYFLTRYNGVLAWVTFGIWTTCVISSIVAYILNGNKKPTSETQAYPAVPN